MFGVFLLVAALQSPWSATPPRPLRAYPAQTGRAHATSTRATPHPRLNIDLSGLSDDDAVAVPGFSPAAAHAQASAARTVVWSPRLGGISAHAGIAAPDPDSDPAPAPIQRQVSTLAMASDFGDDGDAPSARIDPAIGDLIGSVQLPMISNPNAQRPRLAVPVATRAIASAPGRRAYPPGRW